MWFPVTLCWSSVVVGHLPCSIGRKLGVCDNKGGCLPDTQISMQHSTFSIRTRRRSTPSPFFTRFFHSMNVIPSPDTTSHLAPDGDASRCACHRPPRAHSFPLSRRLSPSPRRQHSSARGPRTPHSAAATENGLVPPSLPCSTLYSRNRQ